MLHLRHYKCPKCEGKIIVDRDFYGWFLYCIHCGFVYDLKNVHIEAPSISEAVTLEMNDDSYGEVRTAQSYYYEYETTTV